ncbi:MBL fold metallo-hydrolase [Oryzihumus leptocrescens]
MATMGTTLTFLGAAGTVTGSAFLLERGTQRVLVDCGLYQGEREWRRRNWEPFAVDPATIGNVVLSHAHLDHCGYLPALVRQGFTGPAWCTEGTAALAAIVLRDSAHLQEEDAEHAREAGYSRHDKPMPLYDAADAERAIEALCPCDYTLPVPLADGITLNLTRAGHILGSASSRVDVFGSSVLFSGDLGRPTHPLLLPREDPPAARTVVVESTYGDRTHPAPGRHPHAVLAEAMRRAERLRGAVVVPAFAVDRTELVLRAISDLLARGEAPDLPVYVDSPMALAALEVYARPGLRAELRPDVGPRLFELPRVHAVRSVQESVALNFPEEPCVIVSASGMATGGRVVHHLRHLLPERRNTVVLTGYQAVGTRGRDLAEGARQLKMFGRYVPVRAEVLVDEEFSVHADSGEVLAWLRRLPEPPETVYVVHGEPPAAAELAGRIRDELDWTAVVPRHGEKVRIDPA